MNPLFATWLARIGAAVALLAVLWWAAILPRQQLAAERTAHAETKTAHATVLAAIAAKSEEVARLAAVARDTYNTENAGAKLRHEQEVRDAYERGKSTADGIRSGAVVVREVWRDQCPQAPAGPGAEPAGGHPAVSADRAEAIGRVRAIGGEGDAGYHLLFDRLVRAQGLLNACYEQPAE